MRFIVGKVDGGSSLFVVDGDQACDLGRADPLFRSDLMTVIDGGEQVTERARQMNADSPIVPVTDVRPALPVARPPKVVCLGLNYVDHVKEGGYEIPTYPALFMRAATSLLAAGEPIVRPMASERLDYEAELMVIVGKGGRHIGEADALGHVFGYTTFNDGSVRDYQRKTHQWTPGKNFDATGVVGPVVVTPDELPEGASGLKIESRLNGVVMQSASTSDMMWPVARTIATISEFMTLQPGDLIAMGTPPGVGHARTPPVFMKQGDTIAVEIEGIGVSINTVVDEQSLAASEAAQ